MPYFALQYDVVEDFVNKRTPYRPAHLKEVREANGRGDLVMAGALADPAGALLIFRGADKTVAEIVWCRYSVPITSTPSTIVKT